MGADMRSIISIDGSAGEGGGQILRSALALSIVAGTPFRIERIRAGRAKPGLMRQHLTAVQAAATICGATCDGAEIGSASLSFEPGPAQGGDYHFRIGTAGSTTLVLQTILLPLALAPQRSRVILEGGTHNPFAPPFDFLERCYLPLVNRMGPTVRASLERTGFFPAGGGRFVVEIEPCAKLTGLSLLDRGELRSRRASAAVLNLERTIAERELAVVLKRLNWPDEDGSIVELKNAPGQGNIVMIELEFEHVSELCTGFGEVGRAAEAVAMRAVQQCQRYLKYSAPVGEYLTDQLMLPLALAGGGVFRCRGLSQHARTHIDLIHQFLGPAAIRAEAADDGVVVRSG